MAGSPVERINRALRAIPAWVPYVAGALPACWLIWLLLSNGLGPDPVKPLEHALGRHALQFLIAALCVTPLLRMTGVSLMRQRRALGLLGFAYGVLHLLVWLLLDIQLRWSEIGQDLMRRPYIIIGMVSLLLLVPLALTSRDAVIRRMGAMRWRRLHQLALPATLAAAIHYMMVVKAWPTQPIVYLVLVLALVGWRFWWIRARKSH